MAKKKYDDDFEAFEAEAFEAIEAVEEPVAEPVVEAPKVEAPKPAAPKADLDERGNVRVDMVFGHLPAVPRD